MPKFKIAYIDEEEAEIRNFQRKMANYFEVSGILPEQDIEDFVNTLLISEFDAYVIDFQLNEYRDDNPNPVNYNGSDLVKSLLDKRKNYPCFILTSHALAAAEKVGDVNFVYPKRDLNRPQQKDIDIPTRIRLQIEHYRSAIEKASDRFYVLIQKSEQGLTQDEEDELLNLDSYLENALDAKEALPTERKTEFTIGRIETLIQRSEELITLLKEKNNKS